MSVAPTSSPPVLWDRVVCAIDGTAASLAAAREAARLMPAAAPLTLCTVIENTVLRGDSSVEQALTREAEAMLDRAQEEIGAVHDAELHVREGSPIRLLLDELLTERATLVAVGRHGHADISEAGLGSVTMAMLQDAPCSVLVAPRAVQTGALGAREVVVGFDGSGGARRALAVARELSERLLLPLRVIIATGGQHPPGADWSREELGQLAVSEEPGSAVDALVGASACARLLILGSRHLRGAPALGSVSQHVAHRTECPVLVVR